MVIFFLFYTPHTSVTFIDFYILRHNKLVDRHQMTQLYGNSNSKWIEIFEISHVFHEVKGHLQFFIILSVINLITELALNVLTFNETQSFSDSLQLEQRRNANWPTRYETWKLIFRFLRCFLPIATYTKALMTGNGYVFGSYWYEFVMTLCHIRRVDFRLIWFPPYQLQQSKTLKWIRNHVDWWVWK